MLTAEHLTHLLRTGISHDGIRARLKPEVEAGLHRCAFCGQRIRPGSPWDLGHDDDDVAATAGQSTEAVIAALLGEGCGTRVAGSDSSAPRLAAGASRRQATHRRLRARCTPATASCKRQEGPGQPPNRPQEGEGILEDAKDQPGHRSPSPVA